MTIYKNVKSSNSKGLISNIQKNGDSKIMKKS